MSYIKEQTEEGDWRQVYGEASTFLERIRCSSAVMSPLRRWAAKYLLPGGSITITIKHSGEDDAETRQFSLVRTTKYYRP